jgi:AcrR family transcriptional regulator
MKGFSEQERLTILDTLMKSGRELFSTLGLRKTGIRELTAATNIAQGSFYLFFQSKEELLFRILEEEERAIKDTLLKKFPFSTIDSPSRFSEFLLFGLDLIDKNTIIQRLYFQGEFELLVRKLPPQVLEEHIQQDQDLLSVFLEHWKKLGFLQAVDEKVVGAAIRSFFLLSIHKKEIGEGIYSETVRFMAEAVSNQLFGGMKT